MTADSLRRLRREFPPQTPRDATRKTTTAKRIWKLAIFRSRDVHLDFIRPLLRPFFEKICLLFVICRQFGRAIGLAQPAIENSRDNSEREHH